MESIPRSTCQVCRTLTRRTPRTQRAFTTTSIRPIIPPESPQYIDVPKPYQADLQLPRRPKGILPVPRELFPIQRPDKTSDDYIRRATPQRKPENQVPYNQLNDVQKHRARMAAIRKSHLREGLTELHAREKQTKQSILLRSEAKQAQRERLVSQAEREDVRLTKSTVLQAMQPGRAELASTENGAELYAAKVANVERKRMEKEEERRDKLHTLYMNARDFITTDAQLVTELDRVFAEPGIHRQFNPATGGGKSMWDGGEPDTIARMISKTQTGNDVRRSFGGEDERFKRDQERMKKIAEKLSGGKI